MSNKYYLPNANNPLNQTELLAHLKAIRDRAKTTNNIVIEQKDLDDLKYFVCFYYVESEYILNNFDLDNCSFLLDFSEGWRDPRRMSLWIYEQTNPTHRKIIATSRKGIVPPTDEQNIYAFFIHLIKSFKLEIRKQLAGKSYDQVDLWHSSPTTKEIVDEFLNKNRLNDKLDEIISPNGLGNNVPFLLPDYAHLEKEFLDFYFKKLASDELKYELKPVVNDIASCKR